MFSPETMFADARENMAKAQPRLSIRAMISVSTLAKSSSDQPEGLTSDSSPAALDHRMTLRRLMELDFSYPFYTPQVLGAGPGFMEILDVGGVDRPPHSTKNVLQLQPFLL